MKHTTRPAQGAEGSRLHTIALAGNPNVGKSTVFNRLTGLHQHTGNWSGKTVSASAGLMTYKGVQWRLTDIPGLYSLSPHSAEEEAAAAFLCFQTPDAVVAVCDAGAPVRHLAFVLELAEVTERLMVCFNLMDEAAGRDVHPNLRMLSDRLGMPVTGTAASDGSGILELADAATSLCDGKPPSPLHAAYPDGIEPAIDRIAEALQPLFARMPADSLPGSRFAARKLLEDDGAFRRSLTEHLGFDAALDPSFTAVLSRERETLAAKGLDGDKIAAVCAACRLREAARITRECVTQGNHDRTAAAQERLDRLFAGRWTGAAAMLALLLLVFWLTLAGANVPSSWLAAGFQALEKPLRQAARLCHAPDWLRGLLIDGVYRVVTWVIAVMLPPMAIFFPLFSLLEDAGYLPRAAFCLDSRFRRCGACGKQALTSCMGFGCNAVGVTGCRIIDSPRERSIAVITNGFLPCNGRFPLLTALIAMFFVTGTHAPWDSLLGAGLLTALVCLSVGASLAASALLSRTVLRGEPSSFALELPPFRRPRVLRVLMRSVTNRTLFVLGRAVLTAAPAGALIWTLAHIRVNGGTLLQTGSALLDPAGRLLGMDGVILLAFLLGFPANEIVLPLILMMLLSQDTLSPPGDLAHLHALLTANGWTARTAVCVMLFSLMHWPCATTCLTIYRETRSLRKTAVAILLPTAFGCLLCLSVTLATGGA